MALMSPSPALALPTTMWVVYRYLSVAGTTGVEELMDSVCPPSVRSTGPGQGEATHVKAALRTLAELGIAQVDESGVRLDEQLGKARYAEFIATLRSRITSPETVLQREGNDERPGAADLVRALAWLMQQPTTDVLWWTQNVESRVGRDVFSNDTRWNGFQPWALALGFAEESTLGKGQAGIIANPTRAVLDAFSQPSRVVWPKGEAIPVAEFVSLLLQEIPVMPGGALAERSMLQSSVEGLGAPLSFALLAVETRKSILMEHQSDAATIVQVASADAARSMRPVSHVTVLEKKHA
jgi:hypothetical protein